MDKQKEQKAIDRLKAFEPSDGYYLAYSGGKDSDVILSLAKLAGVKFEAVHNLTTVDAPETVRYVMDNPDVRIDHAHDKNGDPVTMWNLIVKKLIPPTKIARYCCSELKERGGKGRVVVTGVRWAESRKRKDNAGAVKIIGKPKKTQKIADEIGVDYELNKYGGLIMNDDNDINRRMVEQCYRTTKTMLNPIIDWTDSDVWEFLRYYGCKINPLYECGFKRVGCIGCPMANKHRYTEFNLYPKYKQNYISAFDRMLDRRRELGLDSKMSWKTGFDVFKWWLGEDLNQITFDDLEVEL